MESLDTYYYSTPMQTTYHDVTLPRFSSGRLHLHMLHCVWDEQTCFGLFANENESRGFFVHELSHRVEKLFYSPPFRRLLRLLSCLLHHLCSCLVLCLFDRFLCGALKFLLDRGLGDLIPLLCFFLRPLRLHVSTSGHLLYVLGNTGLLLRCLF